VPQIGQKMDHWCWAANAQMIGSFFGSSSLSQCEEVNRQQNASNCCPTNSACNNGDSFHDVAKYWSFPHTSNHSALSFSALKTQINAGQPVVSHWAWTGGGAHFVTVAGYWVKNDGTQHVEVINPLPVDSGDTEWATYDVYLNGGTVDNGSKT